VVSRALVRVRTARAGNRVRDKAERPLLGCGLEAGPSFMRNSSRLEPGFQVGLPLASMNPIPAQTRLAAMRADHRLKRGRFGQLRADFWCRSNKVRARGISRRRRRLLPRMP